MEKIIRITRTPDGCKKMRVHFVPLLTDKEKDEIERCISSANWEVTKEQMEFCSGDCFLPSDVTPAQVRQIHRRVYELYYGKKTWVARAIAVLSGLVGYDELGADALFWLEESPILIEKPSLKIWSKIEADDLRLRLFSDREPFGGSFIYHTTETAAREIFGATGMQSSWGGIMGTHVSIPLHTDLADVQRLRTKVEEARAIA